jgi:hypothetical protein
MHRETTKEFSRKTNTDWNVIEKYCERKTVLQGVTGIHTVFKVFQTLHTTRYGARAKKELINPL